jgi:hypothetical protein
LAAIVISRIASLPDGTFAPEPAKAPAHAHAHKHPTNTFFNLMRVSALIPKKASRRPIDAAMKPTRSVSATR